MCVVLISEVLDCWDFELVDIKFTKGFPVRLCSSKICLQVCRYASLKGYMLNMEQFLKHSNPAA